MTGKKIVVMMGFLTIIGFGGGGIALLHYYTDTSLYILANTEYSYFVQALIGLAFGIFSGWAGWKIISMSFMKPVLNHYGFLIASLNLNYTDIFMLSACAGIGEEIFFRGAIQQFIGIWLTAIIFVAIHGYLNPLKWRICIYGFFMTFAIAALGYMTEYFGIISAMAAHFAIDVYLLHMLVNWHKKKQLAT